MRERGEQQSESKGRMSDGRRQGKMTLLAGKYQRTEACEYMCTVRQCQINPFTAQHHAYFSEKLSCLTLILSTLTEMRSTSYCKALGKTEQEACTADGRK